MLWANLTRIIGFGLQNFRRNIWLSVVTVTIMTLSLLSVSLLGVLSVLSQQALSNLGQKIDIAVYLKPELKADQVDQVKKQVETTIPGVQDVSVITPEEALASFKAKHQQDQLIGESLQELGANPFGASLVIKASSNDAYQSILAALQGKDFTPYIQEARFEDYQRVIQSVTALTDKITRLAGGISLVFLIITLLVVFNTIRINIYTHREEIAIMRLVGATSWFIRGPFWAESVLYALLATLLTAAIFFGGLSLIQPYVNAFFNGWSFDLMQYFSRNSVWFFGAQFLGAVVLTIAAGSIAMRRYLKV